MTRPEATAHSTPVGVEFEPPAHRAGVPYEVVHRRDVLLRKSDADFQLRQRSGFHQLVLCHAGEGVHDVDFEPIRFGPGTLVRIHPGQVQRFVPEPAFRARMVLWPVDSHRVAPDSPQWYPGSDVPTAWQIDPSRRPRFEGWIDELEQAQAAFIDSPNQRALLQSLLTTLLLRLEVELPPPLPQNTGLPVAYLAYRRVIEQRLYQRPSIADLAAEIGYSSRTLDRACHAVSGRTARQVFDERLVLETRRLLTHTTLPAARVGAVLGFDDASNFSRFVRRHLGMTPSDLRRSV